MRSCPNGGVRQAAELGCSSRVPLEKDGRPYHRRRPMAQTPARVEKQPKGLYLLFGVEMWERFSFYGMRAFLALFLADSVAWFGWTEENASKLYGLYNGLCYLTGFLIGGPLTDRILGTKRAVVVGSFLIAA